MLFIVVVKTKVRAHIKKLWEENTVRAIITAKIKNRFPAESWCCDIQTFLICNGTNHWQFKVVAYSFPPIGNHVLLYEAVNLSPVTLSIDHREVSVS